MLGVGVLLGGLSGASNDSPRIFGEACGKRIVDLRLNDAENRLEIILEPGPSIQIFDDGQSCCEDRYMQTDDDLQSFVGSMLLGAEVREGPNQDAGEYDEHETAFLDVKTSLGVFTMCTHVVHNGYYGGFCIVVKEL